MKANHPLEFRLSLAIIISMFLHVIFIVAAMLPSLRSFMDEGRTRKTAQELRKSAEGRDIIVNINQDDQRVVEKRTLLSDRDSSARGFITKKKGDRWLNNSLDFRHIKGIRQQDQQQQQQNQQQQSADAGEPLRARREAMHANEPSAINIALAAMDKPRNKTQNKENRATKNSPAKNTPASAGMFEQIEVPDKNDVTRYNALYYTNDGRFSFNTLKFKNFSYFKKMKEKIAMNWHPPLMANAVIAGYDPLTGGYAPGYTRIMAIPSQEVKLYFIMNRAGDVLEVERLDSLGNEPLDRACLDAIRMSKNFGTVPDDIPGEKVVIPFIFGYYVEY